MKAYGSPDGSVLRLVLPERQTYLQTYSPLDDNLQIIDFVRSRAEAEADVRHRTRRKRVK